MSTELPRKVSQGLFALFFLGLFIQTRYPAPESRVLDLFMRFSPLFSLVAFTGLFFGRAFCGWVCPMGSLIDLGNRLVKPEIAVPTRPWVEALRFLPLVLLIFLSLPLAFGINVLFFLDPLSLFNRIMTVVLFPVITWFIPGVLHLLGLSLGWIPGLSEITRGMQTSWSRWVVPEGPNLFLHIWPVFFLFAGILALEYASPRFWCRYVCPAGAWLGLVSRWSWFGRRVSDACVKCGNCRRDCPMGAIPEGGFETTRRELCTNCLACRHSCPGTVAAISFGFGKLSPTPPLDLSRRGFLGSVAGSIVSVGLLRSGLPNRDTGMQLIRPPGSLPEPSFLLNCVKCMACVRVCRSNGACLQPGTVHGSLLELWAPEAVMRTGYCEYNCNLCGRACPTGAIRRLSVAVKQKTSMGRASFRKDICIPHNRHEDCLVCEEHCPVNDKAIKFETRTVIKPDGSTKSVKFPYVDRKLCIGCGICENKCPLPGQAGVFVAGDDARKS
ncbi:MAG: 4Fe-4S binding protein [Candidatus Ozemobacteraceae bacterium]